MTDTPLLSSPEYVADRVNEHAEAAVAAARDGDANAAKHELREALQRLEALD